MNIAVAFENNEVCGHFGHAKEFKIYHVREDGIITTEVIAAPGTGHTETVALMEAQDIDAVICGSMGEEAMKALSGMGVQVYAGIDGDADQAVDACLLGVLESDPVDVGCGCGGGCGGCGGGCGSGCGGCGSQAPQFEGANVGKTIRAHYRGTLNDGSVFDSSYDRGEPLEFICGAGMMILGFDKAVANMAAGEKQTIHLMPEEAYGAHDPLKVMTIDVSQMPGCEELEIGQMVALSNGFQEFPATVTAREGNNITFDMNHQMAGKELNFEIEVVEIR